MKKTLLFCLASLVLPCSHVSAHLISRETLFQPLPCMAIKISPHAERLAYVGADQEGTMNLYVTTSLSLEESQKATDFKEPEIKGFYWMSDDKTLLLLKDTNGTGQFRLYSVNADSYEITDLTAEYENINAKVFQVSATECKAVIGINHRNPRFHDLYLFDLVTHTLTPFYQNDQFINFLFDDQLEIAVKVKMNPDCSVSLFNQEDALLFDLSAEDAFHTECLKCNDHILYLVDNRGCNTTQLKKIALDGSAQDLVLGHDTRSDITDVYFEGGEPAAYCTYYTQQEWHPLKETVHADIQGLIANLGPNFSILDHSQESQWWVLKTNVPDEGVAFWLYDRSSHQLTTLYASPKIESLAKMYPLVISSRDGLELICYLTLPKETDLGGKPKKPLPLVVVPHGGPFKVRDLYEYSGHHQWLANRGYAVLSVNFRLSSGLGKEFVNAGNGQWGKKAHEDVLDAVQWCINSGIAEKDKIGIFGRSYGGYEALASLTFSPEAFACSIAICGPSNLKTVLDKVPFYWEFPASPLSDKMLYFTKNAFIKSMGGDPDKESDIPYLQSCSPLNHVDAIQKPLLLVHGVHDPIVAASESDQIFEKMREKDLPALYISFPDEGHAIMKFSNEMCYLAHSEWLLSQFLGGAYEPISEKQLKASSAIIRSHGLATKLE